MECGKESLARLEVSEVIHGRSYADDGLGRGGLEVEDSVGAHGGSGACYVGLEVHGGYGG